MGTTVKAICVWQDETDESGSWIVSRDEIGLPGGNALTTTTLDVQASEADAIESAKDEASKLGLPIYRNMQGCAAELVQGVEDSSND